MQQLTDFVPAFSHYLKPLTRDGSQSTSMLFHPGIDGGIALDRAIESQQFRSHRRSTFSFRDLWLCSTLAFPTAKSLTWKRSVSSQRMLLRLRPQSFITRTVRARLVGYPLVGKGVSLDLDTDFVICSLCAMSGLGYPVRP